MADIQFEDNSVRIKDLIEKKRRLPYYMKSAMR